MWLSKKHKKIEVSLGNTKAKVKCVCFPIYHTNHHPRKWKPRNLHGSKLGLEPQKLENSIGTKMNLEWVYFPRFEV